LTPQLSSRKWNDKEINQDRKLKEQKYTNLLKLARMWVMDTAADSAIEALRSLYLPPTRRLELARLYSVDEFVKPAFDVLLGAPLKDLSNLHVQQLGFRFYELLSLGNESLHNYHLSIAFQAPALDFANDTSWTGCANHTRCKNAWMAFWWRHAARWILHPEPDPEDVQSPYYLTSGPVDLEKMKAKVKAAEISGLADHCKQAVLRKIGFERREQILDRIVALAKE
jgi:hypothetical protein